MDHRRILFVLLAVVAGLPAEGLAGRVTLKNGTVIEGELVPVQGLTERLARQQAGEIKTYPFLMVEAGHKRYFLADRQVAGADRSEMLSTLDVFELRHTRSPKSLELASIGLPVRMAPFDQHGRRTVTFKGPREAIDIVQGVTRIDPRFATVEGINFSWWQGIATSALPPDELAAMLRTSIDPEDPDDRMAVARFYIQAGLYEPATRELETIGHDFPELKAKIDELNGDLLQLRAKSLLAELQRRRAAGQHRLAIGAVEAFPTELGFDADVLRQVEAIRTGYAEAREKGDRALVLLGELEATLENTEQRSAVAALRPIVREQLDWDSLSRLDAFLTLADDETLSGEERLALAYSGWAVGSAKATTDLSKTLALWRARHLVGEYLHATDAVRRSELLSELAGLEGVGPAAVAELIPFLPPWIESPGVTAGQVSLLETAEKVPGRGGEPSESGAVINDVAGPVRYAVALPPEYTPTRRYPLLVALRPAEWTAEQAAEFWGLGRDGSGREAAGPATRAGYIVIAPEYASPKAGQYGYTVREHHAVLAAIRDAKKRFVVDGDRVFLAGHGMGADAVFDLAMSHPDLFAGAIPISGLSRYFTKWYWQNAEGVPFYVVNGEKDRNSRTVNAGEVGRMMTAGHDVLYCEFIGRGYEYYLEELPNAFAWMERLRRVPDLKEIETRVLRNCDDRFYWVTAEGIPRSALASDVVGSGVRPMELHAHITPGNSIILRSAASRHILRLNGELVDLDQRVTVRHGGRQVFNDFLVPETEALLDDLRENADRQRLYPVRLVIE